MRTENSVNLDQRLAVLERRVRWYQRLGLSLGLSLVLGVSLAARAVPSRSDVLQTQRLEVVDAAGKARLVAYATPVGGRLEVLDEAGRAVFSAGTVPGGTESVGRWEQTLRNLERQGRELDQQRRLLDDVSRQTRTTPQPQSRSSERDSQQQELNRLRLDVDQQRRVLDAVERQLQNLANQVQTRPLGR